MSRKLPDGYHPRLSGAAIHSEKTNLKCDGCQRLVTGVIGWEKEGEPDKWLCLDCNMSENLAAYPNGEMFP